MSLLFVKIAVSELNLASIFLCCLGAMAPKKKQRTSTGIVGDAGGGSSSASAVTIATADANRDYLTEVSKAVLAIQKRWPGIEARPPLPLVPDQGGLAGFIAPYDATVYDRQLHNDGANLQYSCGVNIFWLNPLLSVTPFVPITKTRVLQQAAKITPGLVKHQLTAHASWDSGANIPRGSVLQVSPNEMQHALLFRVMNRLEEGCDEAEAQMWLRTLLSVPCIFKKLDSDDAKYAENNSIRIEIGGTAKLVVFSARQVIYNVWGFKKRKEQSLPAGQEFSASEIAAFYESEVKKDDSSAPLHKKSTIDACLTLYQRMMSIPAVEQVLCRVDWALKD